MSDLPTRLATARPDLLRVSYDDLPRPARHCQLRPLAPARCPRRPPAAPRDSGSGALSFGTAFHTALLEPADYQPGQPGLNDTLIWWLVEGVKLNTELNRLLGQGTHRAQRHLHRAHYRHALQAARRPRARPARPALHRRRLQNHHGPRRRPLPAGSARHYDYDRQAAFYPMRSAPSASCWWACRKSEPFGVFPLEVPDRHAGRRPPASIGTCCGLLRAPATAPAYRAEAVQAAATALGHGE
ncbi:MAG: hypothetical protein WKG07_42100 [Hymenobacter sp.]